MDDEPKSSTRRQLAGRIAVTVLVSIIIPLATGLLVDKNGNALLTPFEQFVLGALVFLTITSTTIGYEINRILEIRNREHEVAELHGTLETTLANIRASYLRITYAAASDVNLFAQYFERTLSIIADDIYHASTKGELRVDELTFGTTDLLLAIAGRKHYKMLRLVHCLDSRPNNFDFSTWARSYYQELTRLAAEEKVVIQRLFVYGEESELNDPLARRLLAFHATNKGYDYRLIQRDDWEAIVRGLKLPEAHNEFGIWGDSLIYMAIRSSLQHMEGTYTAQARTIARFKEVFDAAWRLSSADQQYKTAPRITVDELFGRRQLPTGSSAAEPPDTSAPGSVSASDGRTDSHAKAQIAQRSETGDSRP